MAGRLNRQFPDPFLVADYLKALAPSFHGGLYPAAELDLGSGLPTLKQIVDVWADFSAAPGFLKEVSARAEAGRRDPGLEARACYYRKLLALELRPPHHISVRLRRLEPGRGSGFFEVVFDRYDAAQVLFMRYTLLLEQQDLGRRALIQREGDYSRQTSALRDRLERYTGDESEITFLLLGKLPGIRIEEVTRCRIGPLWSPWAPAPAGWGAGGLVLHLPSDRASIALDEDRDQDPFATIYRRFLSQEARPLIEEEARLLGYRVHKERKFACTAPAEENLRGRLAQAKTQNLVYAVGT